MSELTDHQREAVKDLNDILREMRVGDGHAQASASNSTVVRADGWVVGLALVLYSDISTQLELHDLRAWKDIHQRDLTALQNRVSQLEQKK